MNTFLTLEVENRLKTVKSFKLLVVILLKFPSEFSKTVLQKQIPYQKPSIQKHSVSVYYSHYTDIDRLTQ